MDVFLAEEAEVGLRADALGRSARECRGLLLGHRRGPRYFVVRVFPLGGRSFPRASRLRQLERLFSGRVIGFYAGRRPEPGPRGILRPFAYGRLLLLVSGTAARPGSLAVRPSVIEYDKGFFLSPISLASGPSRK